MSATAGGGCLDLLSSDAAKRPKMHVTALHTTGLSHIHPVGTRWIKDSGLVSYHRTEILGWGGVIVPCLPHYSIISFEKF